ncbi:unnamed protein product [Mytilus coruscus]|uniref:BEN domain-containing protein n=1 Tax=Mytilus coruscus TaxID=42192 RepID=A0A6J8C6M3_MYTCO|nr:unnamed protein product [Mytilus coruscus]
MNASNEMPINEKSTIVKTEKTEEKEYMAKPTMPAMPAIDVDSEIIESHENIISTNESASGSMLQSHDNSSAGEEEELEFVGAAKYGIKMDKKVLNRILKSSKIQKKLALGLLQPLLTDFEIQNSTVYGNMQFKKEAMDSNKRRAIRSAVFDAFNINKSDAENEEAWKKITVSMNDKIRGLRNGKYKRQ